MIKKSNNVIIVGSLIIATVLWFLMFVVKPMNFWGEMSLSIIILIVIALFANKELISFKKITLRHIIIGVASAALLYSIFYLGNIISGYIFPFKDAQVSSVYSNRSQGSPLFIGMLLLFVIGPGEEIYWRGFIQNTLGEKFGEDKGYIIATVLYAAVHITTLNFMLIVAATACGLFWGYIYKKEKSLIPVLISHALWDLTIFVIFPVM